MSGKRNIYITNYDRLKIVEEIDRGEAPEVIAKAYGLTKSAISRIRKKKHKLKALLAQSNNSRAMQRKTLKTAGFPELEKALCVWIHENRPFGEMISGSVLVEKALIFNEKLHGPQTFKASNGWVDNFKRRHGINQSTINEEKSSSNTEAVDFNDRFLQYITENGYTFGNVYNADETAWNWRSLPQKTLAVGDDNEVPSRVEPITVMFCSNVTGTHKIPVFVIGKNPNPKSFINVASLPVIYEAHISACMNRILFMDWFKECFIPQVKKKQEENGQREKVLLILDNAPSHPAVEELNAIDKDFEVICLPPSLTALIQPMNQGVIEATKRIYKLSLARQFLSRADDTSFEQFMRQLTLKDCCEMIATAWDEVSATCLQKAWNNLLESKAPSEEDPLNIYDISDKSILETVNCIPGFNVSTPDIAAWIHEDDSQQTSVRLDEDEIVSIVAKNVLDDNVKEDVIKETQTEKITRTKRRSHSKQQHNTQSSTAQDAVAGITAVYEWFEMRPECTSSDLKVLNKIRDIAVNSAMYR